MPTGTHTNITEQQTALRRNLAQQALQQANEELEIKVQARTAELQKLNEELKRSNSWLEQFRFSASSSSSGISWYRLLVQ